MPNVGDETASTVSFEVRGEGKDNIKILPKEVTIGICGFLEGLRECL
jgi:hypothetical protein